jgi:cell division protein ZapA
MKQTEVIIMGQSYILACPPGGEHSLLQAVAQVDREMCAIRDTGKVKARERIAVLAALNLAYELARRPPTPASTAAALAVPETACSTDLDALIQRVNQALGVDGQLL